MAIASNKLVVGSIATDVKHSSKLLQNYGLSSSFHNVCVRKFGCGPVIGVKPNFSCDSSWRAYQTSNFKGHQFSCLATEMQKKCIRHSEDCPDLSSCLNEDGNVNTGSQFDETVTRSNSVYSRNGLVEACRFVYNDAKFVNERAKNDIVLLSRGLTKLNDRARHDVQVLGHEFLKLDARAREDTGKIDTNVKKKAAHLNHIAAILKDKAQSDLKRVADQHWSDGALEADLRRVDFLVKRRAMEDAFMALKFVSDIHDMMVNKMDQQQRKEDTLSVNEVTGFITLERNGKATDLFPGEVSTNRITAIQDVYWSMASALSEADGIDYTDPDELELLVATLIDLDAMDGKSTVSLLAECSSSPDVNTRLDSRTCANSRTNVFFRENTSPLPNPTISRAELEFSLGFSRVSNLGFGMESNIDLGSDMDSDIGLDREWWETYEVTTDKELLPLKTRKALANALATAPSMWTLGNAGMGALKRLAEDRNPAVAAAASKAIDELRRQWALEEGDSLQFMLNKVLQKGKEEIDVDPEDDDQ